MKQPILKRDNEGQPLFLKVYYDCIGNIDSAIDEALERFDVKKGTMNILIYPDGFAT